MPFLYLQELEDHTRLLTELLQQHQPQVSGEVECNLAAVGGEI